ncbi:MAG: alpha/beta fold hydrolase [Chitinophagaceae bacterium]
MKKFLTGLFLFMGLISRAQDMPAIMQEYQKLLEDPKNLYGRNPEAGKYYEIRGFKMYCEVYGKGTPLLIIHGNGGSIRDFLYQIPFFSREYQVILADSRSQGKSTDPGDSLTYEMMADDYAALLDAMKIDSAYVIGWSDGGINGLLLAIRHPEKVKKLAITGANLVPDTTAVPQEIWDMVTPVLAQLRAKTDRTEQEKTSLKLFRLLAEQPHIPLTDLQRIACPSLVIGGDLDVIKVEHTMKIYKNISRAYLWIVPGSGHSTPIFFKDEFNSNVSRFFSTPYKGFGAQDRFF